MSDGYESVTHQSIDPQDPTFTRHANINTSKTVDEKHPGSNDTETASQSSSQARRRGFFRRGRGGSGGTPTSAEFRASAEEDDERTHVPPEQQQRENEWEINDDVKMSLG